MYPHSPSLTSPSVVKPKRLRLGLWSIFFIDSKACIAISEVSGWCGYDFGTTNKTPSTVLVCKMAARCTEAEGRS